FVKEENTFQVKKQVREMIVFAVHNIAKDPPFSKIDLLSCRNLLIYMDGALQKRVLPLCHYALNPQGILFLGPSESIGEFTDLFQPVSSKWKTFKRKEFFTEKAPDYPGMPFYHGPRLEAFDEKKPPAELDLHQMAERVILDQFSPAGVLVNDKYEIIHFMGKTDKYLETPTGKASFNILKMAREGLKLKLGTALHNAARQKKTTVHEALRIRYNGTYRIIDLTVRPLLEANLKENFMLVMFADKTPPEKPGSKKQKELAEDDVDPRVTSLEDELQSTKEHLQTTIEELETSNEELKSTNEELQSVNEEMQSTNEELETSKEELQSTNEELITVNSELQNKVDELSCANDDINNLLAVTDIGTIFLDTRLCIKRYTPATKRIFNLIPTDVDRPISDITAKIDYANLAEDAQLVLDTLVQKEREIETEDGVWYVMRMMPYRTTENVIDGLVITFVDVTRMKQWEEEIQRFATVVRDSNDAILLMDFEGKITAWNKGAEKMYGYTEKKALKMNIREMVPRNKADEAEAFVKKLKSGELVDSFETQRITEDGKRLDVWLTVTKLTDGEGKPVAIATTERDVTGKKGF
ncbi:MAG: PAS domain S-box protein, partial [Deltaproteobacteria bacterium]|nr:PAS domain S-box protein [Deltaproteobacteria bacterium]